MCESNSEGSDGVGSFCWSGSIAEVLMSADSGSGVVPRLSVVKKSLSCSLV